MRITYDREVDALYIRVAETTVTTQHLAEGIAADYEAVRERAVARQLAGATEACSGAGPRRRRAPEVTSTPPRATVCCMSESIDLARLAAEGFAARHAGVDLVVLFGSRARGDFSPGSDWDIAFSSTGPIDSLAVRLDFTDALGSDAVDLVGLDAASALLRYRVARDGVPLFERREGAFARFWMQAVEFWCDVAPLVRRGHQEILDDVAR